MEDVETSPWTWYAHCASSSYAGGCMTLGTPRTVVDFWRHYHNIPTAGNFTRAQVVCQGAPVRGYAFFREGVLPEWEDASNRHGGEFIMRVLPTAVDAKWTDLLLGCIGGAAPLVGVRCIAKAPVKLEAWYGADVDDAAARAWLDAHICDASVIVASHKRHADLIKSS
jgi:hypothetical protein